VNGSRDKDPFTESEYRWTVFACIALQRLLAEEGPKCSSADGFFRRTYRLDQSDSVTICYDMDAKYGEVWSVEEKWRGSTISSI
jgi:hypothetical protein